jgi:molybdopterin converting factor small subunit
MVRVKFTSHLYRFFPGLSELQVEAANVAEVISKLDEQYPGLGDYIVDETGALRKHVNIFIGDSLIYDRQCLRDSVKAGDQVFIMQALSGG